MRWAPVVAVEGFNTSSAIYELPRYDPPAGLPPDTWKSVHDLLVVGGASGISTAVCKVLYQIVRGRVDSKNGRKIRVKDGDFELETTQLSVDEFMQLLETLRDANSTHHIKSKLLDAGFRDKTQPAARAPCVG